MFRSKLVLRTSCLVAFGGVVVLAAGCRGATRDASAPHGKTQTTSASVAPRIDRLLVAEGGDVALLTRGGCVASVRTSPTEAGAHDELRVRCPRPERMSAWFDAADRELARVALAPVASSHAKPDASDGESENDSDSEDDLVDGPPSAKVLTSTGQTMKVVQPADVKKLTVQVHALVAELAAAEKVAPGPASPAGWQMIHVMGPAHVVFAGAPAHGLFEARMSTNGQYLCEFVANVGDGPLHATKSGWIKPDTATHAIDQVLVPFNAVGDNERPRGGYAEATTAGSEKRSNASSTAAVFERFAQVQDALGDACLPELEPPAPANVSL